VERRQGHTDVPIGLALLPVEPAFWLGATGRQMDMPECVTISELRGAGWVMSRTWPRSLAARDTEVFRVSPEETGAQRSLPGAGAGDLVGPRDPFMRGLHWFVIFVALWPAAFALWWWVSDQSSAACNGTWGSPPRNDCAEANTGLLLFCAVVSAAAVVWRAAWLRQRATITAEGIMRRGLLGDEFIPWSDVRTIRKQSSQPWGGGIYVTLASSIVSLLVASGVYVAAKATDTTEPLWRVEAVVNRRTRSRVTLGEVRGQAAADQWISAVAEKMTAGGSRSSP